MPTTKPQNQPSRPDKQQSAQRRALDAVQEALDRRDNGGDAAATDN